MSLGSGDDDGWGKSCGLISDHIGLGINIAWAKQDQTMYLTERLVTTLLSAECLAPLTTVHSPFPVFLLVLSLSFFHLIYQPCTAF